jgi:hypothetical protein
MSSARDFHEALAREASERHVWSHKSKPPRALPASLYSQNGADCKASPLQGQAAAPQPIHQPPAGRVIPIDRECTPSAEREGSKLGSEAGPLQGLGAAAPLQRQRELRLKRKIDQAHGLLDRLEAKSSALAREIKRLQQTKTFTEARIERIEERAVTEMEAAGLAQATGIVHAWRAQPAAKPALEVVNEKLVPRKFTKPNPGEKPDKIAIKAALDADRDLDPAAWGCVLKLTTSLIRR